MAHPLRQRGTIDVDALAAKDHRLAVERNAVTVFRDSDVGQQPRPWPALLDRQYRRRRLEDLLAQPAGISGPDVSDHLERRGNLLQHFGRGLTELGQARGIAAAAAAGSPAHAPPPRAAGEPAMACVRWASDAAWARGSPPTRAARGSPQSAR